MELSQDSAELFKALALFRKKVKQPLKDKENPFFKSNYVTLEGVQKAIDESLPDTGLAYLQNVEDGEKGKTVTTLITHESGQWLRTGKLSLPPKKNDAQGNGSSITYARRYQLSAAFGISSDIDDDGNKANGNGYTGQKRNTAQYQRTSSQRNTSSLNAKKQLVNELYKKIADSMQADAKSIRAETIKQAATKPEWEKSDDAGKQAILLNVLNEMEKALVKQ